MVEAAGRRAAVGGKSQTSAAATCHEYRSGLPFIGGEQPAPPASRPVDLWPFVPAAERIWHLAEPQKIVIRIGRYPAARSCSIASIAGKAAGKYSPSKKLRFSAFGEKTTSGESVYWDSFGQNIGVQRA
jgi:hypothetical protein